MHGRPVMARAQRNKKRFASLAVAVNCHIGRPKRASSSAATSSATAEGSMVVAPCAPNSASVRAMGAGLWPNIAPVSPRQKSMISCPSASTRRAPCAASTKSGNGAGVSAIQCMGTPNRKCRCACACSAAQRGCAARKRCDSAAKKRAIWALEKSA
jgi:hypothetical protein